MSLRKFRFTAWLYTTMFCGIMFVILSQLWDGNLHPLVSLLGAIVVATGISLKERCHDFAEWNYEREVEALRQLKSRVDRGEATPNEPRREFETLLSKAPQQQRGMLRMLIYRHDPCEMLKAKIEIWKKLVADREGSIPPQNYLLSPGSVSTHDCHERRINFYQVRLDALEAELAEEERRQIADSTKP